MKLDDGLLVNQAPRPKKRNYNGLANRKKYLRQKSTELQWFGSPRRYRCSFEQGITMVWRTVSGVLVERAWNYIALGALAFEQGITLVWRTV